MRVSAINIGTLFGGNKAGTVAKREAKKQELLEAIKPLQRGVAASPEDKAKVDSLCKELERANPNKSSLASPLVNGKWELVYTTSDSILGSKKPALLRPSGRIYQFIDAANLKARNQETFPFFNSVTAELTPTSKSAVDVQFKTFKLLGLVPITAPPTARGALDVTYVDEEMRISRGDKGNLFVLLQRDPKGKP